MPKKLNYFWTSKTYLQAANIAGFRISNKPVLHSRNNSKEMKKSRAYLPC
jgi:hypothetical protein